jgi:hypothetical protein
VLGSKVWRVCSPIRTAGGRGVAQMTCPTCPGNVSLCYVCRATITNYDHFCGHARAFGAGGACPSACGKCLMYTNTQEDDERDVEAERRAAEAELLPGAGAAIV